jgi:excisionase family DNA binding protein
MTAVRSGDQRAAGGGRQGPSETRPGSLETPRELARRLGVPLRTVYLWTEQGRLPHVKLGRLTRFRPEDIKAIIDRGIE